MCNYLSTADQNVPEVSMAMKEAREIVQYFNKSTQATKKLKDYFLQCAIILKH
jgi:hypothetical protein